MPQRQPGLFRQPGTEGIQRQGTTRRFAALRLLAGDIHQRMHQGLLAAAHLATDMVGRAPVQQLIRHQIVEHPGKFQQSLALYTPVNHAIPRLPDSRL